MDTTNTPSQANSFKPKGLGCLPAFVALSSLLVLAIGDLFLFKSQSNFSNTLRLMMIGQLMGLALCLFISISVGRIIQYLLLTAIWVQLSCPLAVGLLGIQDDLMIVMILGCILVLLPVLYQLFFLIKISRMRGKNATDTTKDPAATTKDPAAATKDPAEERQHPEDRLSVRLLTPLGSSGWAIATGYLGIFSFIPFLGFILAILSIVCGIIAIIVIKSNPHKHGVARIVIGWIVAIPSFLVHLALISGASYLYSLL